MTIRVLPVSESRLPGVRGEELKRSWFAVALAALMAVLLALVPLIGSAAAPLVLLALVPLSLWLALRDTEKALYLYFVWCWMDGTIRGLFHSDPVSIVARDLVMAVIILGWGMSRVVTRERDPIRLPPGSLLVALFVLNCLLQVANPYSLGWLSCLAGFKMHFAFLPLLFIGYDVFRRSEQVRQFLLFLTLATLVISVVSVVQYLQGPSWTYDHFPGCKQVIGQNIGMLNPDQDSEVTTFKPPGTTTFGGGTGSFIGLILPLSFSLVLLSRGLRFGITARAALIGVLFAFVVAVFLNGVRSGLVNGIVGIMICALLVGGKNAARFVTVGAACLALGWIGWNYSQTLSKGNVADRFGSTFADPNKALHDDRATFFDQFYYLVTKAPLGVGLGRVGAAAGQFGSDQGGTNATVYSEAYLGNMIGETGILGALLIFSIAIKFILDGFVGLRRQHDTDDKLLAASLLAVLVTIVTNFFTTPILLGLPGAPLFWLLAAMLLRVYATAPQRLIRQPPGLKA